MTRSYLSCDNVIVLEGRPGEVNIEKLLSVLRHQSQANEVFKTWLAYCHEN